MWVSKTCSGKNQHFGSSQRTSSIIPDHRAPFHRLSATTISDRFSALMAHQPISYPEQSRCWDQSTVLEEWKWLNSFNIYSLHCLFHTQILYLPYSINYFHATVSLWIFLKVTLSTILETSPSTGLIIPDWLISICKHFIFENSFGS